MTYEKLHSRTIAALRLLNKLSFLFFVFLSFELAPAYERASINIGGGYSSNLYADSFDIGNSYLVNNIAVSSARIGKTGLRFFYGLSYYEYDTNNRINNFYHAPGIALFGKSSNQNFKWNLNASAGIKDYTDEQSGLDNYRVIVSGDASYYANPATLLKGWYKETISHYNNFGSLDNSEHWIESELVLTFPTKTTARIIPRYVIRDFDDGQEFDWLDFELGFSQSLDIRTGLSASALKRWSGGGSRPLSSYYILSGITPYWDPWDGVQLDLSLKRIFPLAIVSQSESGYWRRRFSYDRLLRDNLPWLRNTSGRTDEGWFLKASLSRQINLNALLSKAVAITFDGGFYSNRSSDRFYKYDFFFLGSNLEIRVF